MFGKVLSFCTRRDGAFKRKAARRLGSSRASVFLEYALVLPLTVMIISAMIEFAAFWDAKIMANHAAWTCARIATVEAGQKNYTKDKGREPVVVTKGMKTATILLMSTCAMGSMHGSASGFVKDWFVRMIKAPLVKLQKELMDKLQKKLVEVLKKAIGKFVGKDVISKIVAEFLGVIAEKLFTPLINEIASRIGGLFQPMFDALGNVLDGQRQLRQLAYAAGRLNEFPSALTVTERTDPAFVFAKEGGFGQLGDSRLDFPRILDATVTNDSWFVANDVPWPPNGQWQRMIDVKIRWPFERAWIFPVLSPWKSPAKSDKDDPLKRMPTAVGRAMAYPQPIIKNENLKSKGAEPYAPGKEMKLPDIVKKIKDKYIGFLKTAALYYHYQLGNEETGPYDSCSKGTGSYKGLGLPSKYADKGKIYQRDGLVAWMERLPEHPGSHEQWQKKSPPADYYRCWKEITTKDSETAQFWYGIPFAAFGKAAALTNLEEYRYRGKEWFFWGSDVSENGRHLRLKHREPIKIYDGFSTKKAFVYDDGKGGTVEGSYGTCFIIPGWRYPTPMSVWEFDAQKGNFGCPNAEHIKDYYFLLEPQGRRFEKSHCVVSITEVWCRDWGVGDRVRRDELALFERLKGEDQNLYAKAKDLISNCSKELDNAVGGGGGGAGDMSGLIDFGGIDDIIMKDPKKAVEILDKKLQELKGKVLPAILKVDAAERRLRELDGQWESKGLDWFNRRRNLYRAFVFAYVRAHLDAGGITDPDVLMKKILDYGDAGTNPNLINVLNEMKSFFTDYHNAIKAYYDAQIELGKALNCKAAKEAEKGRDDPKPLPGPGGNPDRPKPSSADSGSDPDNGGDFWRLTVDGWRQYNEEPDI